MADDTRLSMAEQLGSTWDKMEQETPERVEAPERPEPEVKPERTADERARDEAGRFAEKPKLTLKEKPVAKAESERAAEPAIETKPPEASGKPGVVEDKTAQQAAKPDDVAPPMHWNGKGKVEWQRLPAGVKQQIAADYQSVNELRPLASVLEPFRGRFNTEFGGTDKAIGQILNGWHFARTQPVDFVATMANQFGGGKPLDFLQQVARQFGVDPRALQAGNEGGQPALDGQSVDPEIAALRAELQRLGGELNQVKQQPVLAQNANIDRDIAAFGANTAHPYFNDVKPIMQAILATPGLVKAEDGPGMLKEAYDQACWANPQIRAALQADAAAKAAEARKTTVMKAQQAGGSINGAPGVAKAAGGNSHQSVAASLSDNWDKLEARI